MVTQSKLPTGAQQQGCHKVMAFKPKNYFPNFAKPENNFCKFWKARTHDIPYNMVQYNHRIQHNTLKWFSMQHCNILCKLNPTAILLYTNVLRNSNNNNYTHTRTHTHMHTLSLTHKQTHPPHREARNRLKLKRARGFTKFSFKDGIIRIRFDKILTQIIQS